MYFSYFILSYFSYLLSVFIACQGSLPSIKYRTTYPRLSRSSFRDYSSPRWAARGAYLAVPIMPFLSLTGIWLPSESTQNFANPKSIKKIVSYYIGVQIGGGVTLFFYTPPYPENQYICHTRSPNFPASNPCELTSYHEKPSTSTKLVKKSPEQSIK